jgi:hypothetical protein
MTGVFVSRLGVFVSRLKSVGRAPRAGDVYSGERPSAAARHQPAMRHRSPPPTSCIVCSCYKVRVSAARRARGPRRA